jgi:hypothetical protein
MFLKELPLDPLIIAFSAFCFSKSAAAIYTSLLGYLKGKQTE